MSKSKRVLLCGVITLAYILGSCLPAAAAVEYPAASGKQQLTNDVVTIDISNQSQGYIMIRHKGSRARLKATTVHNGRMYLYDLPGNGEYEIYPLTQGNGEYSIGVYEQIEKDKDMYYRVFFDRIDVYMPDPLNVFRIPNQYVWFTDDSALVKKSMELCADAVSDYEKINILYRYVSERLLYDYVKAVTVAPPYLPDADETLRTGRGICFDFAVLLAGMLRVQGIPAQLVIGKLLSNNPPMDHAWNKVFLDGTWLMMDPSFNGGAFRQADYVEERVY